jgi:ABC-2 type transport system permease protein
MSTAAGSTSGDARILEGGYRRYDGVRSGSRGAIRSTTINAMQRALGLRRSARYKILPVLAAILAYVPAIVYAGVAALFPPNELIRNQFLPSYGEYYFFITAAIVLFCAFVAPEVLCTDRRTGMLGIYLASPLTRTTYLLSKGLSVLFVLAIVTLGPPLFLLIAYVLVGTGPDGPIEVVKLTGEIVLAGALISTFYGTLSLAVSSITDRKAAASAAIVVILLLSSVVTGVLVEGADATPYLLLADLFFLPFQAVFFVFGEAGLGEPGQPVHDEITGPVVFAACFAWTLLFSSIVAWRYHKLEVTR